MTQIGLWCEILLLWPPSHVELLTIGIRASQFADQRFLNCQVCLLSVLKKFLDHPNCFSMMISSSWRRQLARVCSIFDVNRSKIHLASILDFELRYQIWYQCARRQSSCRTFPSLLYALFSHNLESRVLMLYAPLFSHHNFADTWRCPGPMGAKQGGKHRVKRYR